MRGTDASDGGQEIAGDLWGAEMSCADAAE